MLQIDAKNQREKWMIDLPSIKTPNLGLSSRKFKLREGPDILDRSCWTDTPIQKAQKQKDLVNIITILSSISTCLVLKEKNICILISIKFKIVHVNWC